VNAISIVLKAVKGGTKRVVNSLFKQEKFTKIQYKGKSYLIVPSKNQFDMKMEPIILLLGSAFLGDPLYKRELQAFDRAKS